MKSEYILLVIYKERTVISLDLSTGTLQGRSFGSGLLVMIVKLAYLCR